MPKPTDRMKFKLKDRVKVNAPSSSFHGKRGNVHIVYKHPEAGTYLLVKFVDEKNPIAFFPSELTHV